MSPRLLAALAAALLAAPAAHAQSVVSGAVAPFDIDWTGPYAGVSIGYGYSFNDGDDDFDGVIGGGQIGYQLDTGQAVVGVELAWQFADFTLDPGNAVDQLAHLKLRAGAGFDRALPYVTAGGAFAAGTIDGDDETGFGFAVGAGVDYLLTDNVLVGAEYLYSTVDDLGDADFDAGTLLARLSFRF